MTTAIASSGPWWDIAWQDWVGVAGTALGVVGLALTFLQARAAQNAASKAQTAAEAASQAVQRTQNQVRANMQLVLLPGLQRITQEIDDAILRKSYVETKAALDRWRFQAGHVRGLLERETPEPKRVLQSLQESVVQCSIASIELLSEKKTVLNSCREARSAIAAACDGVTQLAGKNVTQMVAQKEDSR